MIYLKTIFSAPNEIKFIKLNLRESGNNVDKFIICEFNRTHVGEPRELIFKNYLNEFSEEEKKKIIYLGVDLSKEILLANGNSELAHNNEQLMRGYFVKEINLDDNDIVFSVDADEIIFKNQYDKIINKLTWWRPAVKLNFYQFFYCINYLWEEKNFIAPTVCFAKYYKNKFPGQWRYNGRLYKEMAGCHFSWCLSIDDMLQKMNMYAHREDYKHLAKRDILEEAIKNKTYPFDPKTDFKIKVLNIDKDRQFYPQSIYTMLDNFKDLVATE